MKTNKNVTSCRKHTTRVLAMLATLMLAVILSFSACTGGTGDGGGGLGGLGGILGGGGTEPVYTGMTIGDTAKASAQLSPEQVLLSFGMSDHVLGKNENNNGGSPEQNSGSNGDAPENNSGHNGKGHVSGALPGNEADQNDPFDQVESGSNNSDILLEDAKDSLQVQGAAKPIYYAQKSQDIYITVHIDNPDSYEILSFTLNGNKYSSYMFEPGSDMENLILKVNVGDVEGVQEYTIDAIKYVDGTDIKDVRMDGDKTVRAGVWSDKQPVSIVQGESIGFNDISFEVSVEDALSLIAQSEGTVMAVLYDGETVLNTQTVTLDQATPVKFEGLTTNSLYQYAILAYYDALDGTGANVYVLQTKAFYTNAILLFNNVTLGTQEISYELLWHDNAPDKTVTSLVLEHATEGKVNLPADSLQVTDLLSANEYTLTASYLNGANEESVSITFTTKEKTVPTLSMNAVSASQSGIEFSLDFADPDGIAKLEKLQLISAKTGVVDVPVDARSLTDLLSDTEYIVRATYYYDLGDGNGIHVETEDLVINTLQRATPLVTLTEESKTQTGLAFQLSLTDPDSVATLTKLELICDKTGSTEASTDTRSFEGLLSNTVYTIRVTYTYDLGDGDGAHEATQELKIRTVAKTTPKVTLSQVSKGKEELTFDVSTLDPDTLLTLTKLELICANGDTVEADLETREFGGLLSNTAYTVRMTYIYDLNDGNGVQEATSEVVIKTGAKIAPQFSLTEIDKSHDYINVSSTEIDPDGVAQITDLSIYLDDELIASSETFDAATFSELISNHTYKIVLTYEYDLNDGNGVITKTVELSVLTKVLFYPVSAEVGNTSAVSEGEYVYIDVTVVNPGGAVINTVRINGKDYPAIATSSNEVVRVEIKHENQFEGGLTDFVVESLTATANGETHTYTLDSNNVATVFINGKLIVESIGVVDDEGTLIDYAFPSDFIGIYVALSNKTGYDVDRVVVRDYNQYYGYNQLVFTADQIIMLDQNTLLIPLHNNRYGGIHSYQVEAITYSNFSISGKELTVETERYDVMYFDKDEVVQVSTPEDLLNMNEWAYYELANDIDLNGMEWSTPGDFRGYFDGNYYTIKNMKVATTFENTNVNIGLFKYVSGKIENLTLDNIVVTVNASNTLPNQWYEINYGAIASYVNYRIVMNNVRVNHNTVTVNTTGSNINAYVGHLIARPTDQCYVTNSVVSTGNVTCNSSPVSADYLGQSTSKLPAKPTFDTNSDPALFFDSAVTHNGITYLCLNNGVAIVIGFDGSVNDIVIGLDGYTITTIPSRVFYNYDNITSVVIPEGVVTIGYEAFASCDMLASITLPSTLTEIGEGSFRECYALASITLPTSLRIIGNGAFSNCSQLKSIIIPEGVTQIGNYAFQSCWSVTEISLPSTLTTIGHSTFNGVNARVVFIPAAVTSIGDHAFSQSINIYAAAAKAPSGWSQYWNGEQSNQVTWGVESILTDASGVIYALMGDNTAHVIGYTANLTEAVIGVDGYVVTKIVPYAFHNCDTLVSITIPNTVIEIGEYAFNSCDILKSVTLSNKLTKISKYTFSECDALVSIVIPEGVKVIEEQAFYSCGNLTSVTLPGTLTSIERHAFHYCDIRELILPNSVTKIGEHAFADNYNLTSLTLSSALTSIENYAFAWGEMQNVIIPEGVTSIGDYAFAYCYSIRSVTLPSTLTSIGARAFEGEYLQIVFIPASVTSIGEYAFSNGTIYTCVPEAPTGWNPSWNGNNREEYVVWGVEKYFTDDYGVTYVLFADGTASIAGVSGTVSEIVLGGNPDFPVTEIPANLLNGRSDITKITIHQSITKIGANAFSGGNWRHIQLPLTVKEIGENAFGENYVYVSNNKKLTDWHENWYGWDSNTVVWDAPAGELYTDEVYGNTYLLTEDGWAHLYRYRYQNSELTIAGVEGYKVVVHGGSTNGNWELRKLTLLEGVVKLDDSAFRYNYNLNQITLPASLEEIGAYAFASTSIEKVVLSDSIKTIGKEAFTSGSIFVICATKPEGWHANWCTANTVWDFKDTYTDENGVSYVLTNSGYAYVYNYDHEASELIIGAVEGYKVVIGANLFSGNNNITKITLEEGVVEVASYAFAYCNNLTEIVFPASLTTIGDHAFYNTGLQDVKIPATVEKIGLYAFTCEKIYPDARFQPAGWDTRWFSGNTMNIFWCFKELYEDTDNGITYILHNDGTASVYSFDGTKDTVVIIAPKDHKVTYIYSEVFKQSNIVSITLPDTLTAIGDRAFYDCDSLISIVIPEGVTSIGTEAFHDCDKLFSVTLPSTLTEIPEHAFYSCDSLKIAITPEGLTKIGRYAFYDCYCLSVTVLPSTLTEIGDHAFYNVSNHAILFIPEGVTSIGSYAFNRGKVYYSGEQAPTTWNSEWCSYGEFATWNVDTVFTDAYGVTYVKLNDGTTYIDSVSGVVSEIVLGGNPDFPVTEIPANLLHGRTDITKVTIDPSITTIGEYAFNSCKVHIILPQTVTKIGTCAFQGCYVYTTFTEENKPKNWNNEWHGWSSNVAWGISDKAELYVAEDGHTYLLVEDGVAHLYFYEKTTELTILGVPEHSTIIHGNTNNDWTVEKLTIGEGIVKLDAYAFYYWGNLKEVNLPKTLTEIGYQAFYNCDNLESIVLPEGVITIGNYAFDSCSNLAEINFPASLTNIGDYAFRNTALEDVKIPVTVEKIGTYAFNCEKIYPDASSKPAGWAVNWFEGDSLNVFWNFKELYVDEENGITYILHNDGTASVYSFDDSVDAVVLINPKDHILTNIYANVFRSTGIVSITLPESLTTIGDFAFYDCRSLEEITLPAGLQSIGSHAFYRCQSLAQINLPESLTTIGDYAFYDCDNLITVIIPDSVTSIGNYVFSECNGLTGVTLPSTLTEIPNGLFSGCNMLSSIVIPEGVEKIGACAFQNCHSLSSVTLPSTLTTIGDSAFTSNRLQTLTLPASVTTIGNYAFAWSSLQIVHIPTSVTTIGYEAFTNGYVYVCADKRPSGWDSNWNGSDRKDYAKFGFKEFYTDSYGVTYALFNNKTATLSYFDGQATVIVLGVEGFKLQEIPNGFFSSNSLVSVIIPEGVTKIGDCAFQYCYSLASVTLPSTLTKIGESAFRDCNSLTEIVIPGSVSTISPYAFTDCDQLSKVVISEGTTTIGHRAFQYCYSLVSVTLPSTLTTIGEYAFYEISGSHNTVIPTTVTSIGEYAFNNGKLYSTFAEAPTGWSSTWCGGFDRVVWNVEKYFTDEYGVTYIKYSTEDIAYILSVNGTVSEIVLGGNPDFPVTEIPPHLLNNRSGFTKITIADGITTIGERAFIGVHCIVIIPESVTTIGTNALYNCFACIEADEKPEGWADDWHNNNENSRNTYAYWGFEELYTDENGITYALTNKGIAYVCGYEAGMTEITIGGLTIDEKTYDVIISGVFQDDLSIEKVTLLDGVIVVDDRAFRQCSNLKELTLPETLTEIGYDAFYSCKSLSVIVLPDSLKTVEDHAFCHAGCYVSLPATVETIEQNAFYECYVFTKASKQQEGWHSNWNGYSSNNVIWNTPKGTLHTAEDGRVYLLDEDNVAHLFFYEKNSTELTINAIPGYDTVIHGTTAGNSTVEKLTIGKGVIKLAENAFYNWYNLKSVSLPDTLTEIGEHAFYNCDNLESIKLPEGVTSIGNNAFTDCSNLAEINFPASLTTIGDSAFRYTALTDVKIPVTVEKIGACAFSCEKIYPDASSKPAGWAENWFTGSALNVFWNFKEFYVDEENGITYIIHNDNTASVYSFDASSGVTDVVIGLSGDYADYKVITIYHGVFAATSITSVVIPEGVISIGTQAFASCYSLKSVSLPSTLQEIGTSAFNSCNALTSINLPDNVTTIGICAFYQCCNAQMAKLPDALVSIGSEAFYGVTFTDTLTIPKSVTTIGWSALHGNVIVFHASKPEGWHENWHNDNGGTITWNVKEIYTDATYGVTYVLFNNNTAAVVGFDDYHTNVEILSEINGCIVTEISPNAFKESEYLEQISLPDTLIKIGEYAFYNCDALTSIVIPDGVTEIGKYAFFDCDALTSIVIPDGVTEIGERTFYDCDALTSIVIPDGVTEIGEHTFYDCDALTSVVIPEGVTKIGEHTFYDCDALTSIVIPEGVTQIGYYAFASCGNLRSITLPSTLVEIGGYAFAWSGLHSVTIPESVTTIKTHAFAYGSLQNVLIPSSVTEIGEYAFTSGMVYVVDYKIETRPTGWVSGWNGDNRKDNIVWGVKSYYTDEYGVTYAQLADDTCTIICVSGAVSEIVLGGNEDYPITEIPANLLQSRTEFSIITIDPSIESIGSNAFNSTYCHILIPETVKTIGNNAFSGACAYVPFAADQVPANWNIGYSSSVVWNATGGTLFTAEDGLTYWLREADKVAILFSCSIRNTGSTELYIGGVKGYTTVVHGNTNGNWYFKKVIIDEGVTILYDYAFYNWYNLEEVVLPETLQKIGAYAFGYCYNLTELTIPESVNEIGDRAFYDCDSLKTIYVPGCIETIGYYAFGDCQNATIYTDASVKPEGWSDGWNGYYGNVNWGYTPE